MVEIGSKLAELSILTNCVLIFKFIVPCSCSVPPPVSFAALCFSWISVCLCVSAVLYSKCALLRWHFFRNLPISTLSMLSFNQDYEIKFHSINIDIGLTATELGINKVVNLHKWKCLEFYEIDICDIADQGRKWQASFSLHNFLFRTKFLEKAKILS